MTIQEIQRALMARGLLPARADDGIYGPKTKDAVRVFQIEAHLDPDGDAGPLTQAELKKPIVKPTAASPAPKVPLAVDPAWLSKARTYIGQKEIKGAKHNPMILRMWTLIRAPFTDDETPWCAGFVGGVLEEVGIKSSRSAAARSYLKWGVALGKPEIGAIVVFERGPVNGHVGFIVGIAANGNLLVLGGNQGDMVKISPFDPARKLGYRWPAGVPLPGQGIPVLASHEAVSTNEA